MTVQRMPSPLPPCLLCQMWQIAAVNAATGLFRLQLRLMAILPMLVRSFVSNRRLSVPTQPLAVGPPTGHYTSPATRASVGHTTFDHSRSCDCSEQRRKHDNAKPVGPWHYPLGTGAFTPAFLAYSSA